MKSASVAMSSERGRAMGTVRSAMILPGLALGLLCAMQISFWYRMRYVPIPFRHPNMILNHAFLFLDRLSFIFGSALFSVVGFRHLSELDRGTDILAARRGIILVGCLFALFSLNPLPPSIELLPPEMP